MIRRALRGLRGRLLLAFVFTSAVTLLVAAAITLSPLQSRLRTESANALQNSTESLSADFANALKKSPTNRPLAVATPSFELSQRAGGARVLTADYTFTK